MSLTAPIIANASPRSGIMLSPPSRRRSLPKKYIPLCTRLRSLVFKPTTVSGSNKCCSSCSIKGSDDRCGRSLHNDARPAVMQAPSGNAPMGMALSVSVPELRVGPARRWQRTREHSVR